MRSPCQGQSGRIVCLESKQAGANSWIRESVNADHFDFVLTINDFPFFSCGIDPAKSSSAKQSL